ncbi:MAG: cyclopropane-fatty-acyl-phospholipid synthase family protein [Elusimicrobiota bacterium]|nr:MAG: cyclopropane-fatty-acyl-phospholipid synthase family protein [Elusimicrobiota bacterium]
MSTLTAARPSSDTGFFERAGMSVVLAAMEKIRHGRLTMALPDGTVRVFGDPRSPLRANVAVRRMDFFRRVLLWGDVGFGEAYTAGDFETDDLTALIRLFIDNGEAMEVEHTRFALWGKIRNRLRHLFNANTVAGSRRNIYAHYDLGNDFFKLFLDPTLMYSCARFENGDTLEAAQRRKVDAILDKARIVPGDSVLEIGSGWGTCAIEAARRGATVTTLTISERQFEFVKARIKREGLEHKVKVLFCDYRRAVGRYDKIVSIEMIEAVGHEFLGTFFATCDRLLKPDGLVVIQAITIPDQRYEAYRRGCDWIQKHIFPGALLPSLTALSNAMTANSNLMVENVENIGIHYARTLREWRDALQSRSADAKALGFDDEFLRTWEYYFSYCEAGFAARVLGDLQLVLTRPNNARLPGDVK